MRAVIYACVDGHNSTEAYINAQVSVCQAYAEAKGMAVLGVYVDRLLDGSRPGFQQLINDSVRRMFDEVIVFKLDRFAVTRSAHSRFKDILRDNGVAVLSATEYIPDTPEGILIESMLEGMSEYTDMLLNAPEREEKSSVLDSVADIAEVIPGLGGVTSAIKAVQGVREVTDAVAGIGQQQAQRVQGFPQQGFPQPQYAQQSQYTQQQSPQQVVQPQQAVRQTRKVPKPKTDMENFFGKHIAAILAGILIIAATVTTIFMAWDSVPEVFRFLMLAVFGVVMLSAALVKHEKIPEFLTYPVIKNLFASAGLAVIFITFLLGHAVLGLYDMVVAGVLLAVWGAVALFILRRFRIVSATVVGAVGMAVGCWVTTGFEPSEVFSLIAVALGCLYLIAALYEHTHITEKSLGLYIFFAVVNMVVLTSALPVVVGTSASILAVLSVVSVASMAYIARKHIVAGNIIYLISLGIWAAVFIFAFGWVASFIFAVCVIVSAVVAGGLRLSYAPAALASLLFAYVDKSFILSGYVLPLCALVGIAGYLAIRDDFGRIRKWIGSISLCAAIIMSLACAADGHNLVAGVVILVAAFIFNRYVVTYCLDYPFGQLIHIGSAIIGVIGCYVLSPEIFGIGELAFIMLSAAFMVVYLKFGYNAVVDTPLYRNLLLPVCSLIAVVQGGLVIDAALPGIAFVPVLAFAGMLFYRFIMDARNPKNSVSALWIIASIVFLWLNFLVPTGFDVVPSVVMIGVGFAVISFGFVRRRNAERISGLVMVILCTVKAVSFDVWFAAPPVRVVALFVGAGICIAVSRLYAKQSATLRGAEEAVQE